MLEGTSRILDLHSPDRKEWTLGSYLLVKQHSQLPRPALLGKAAVRCGSPQSWPIWGHPPWPQSHWPFAADPPQDDIRHTWNRERQTNFTH